MDDQFGGRTDDDLFYDDLEPVDSAAPVVAADIQPPPEAAVAASPPSANTASAAPVPPPPRNREPRNREPRNREPRNREPTSAPVQPPKRNLASSRFADKPAAAPAPADASAFLQGHTSDAHAPSGQDLAPAAPASLADTPAAAPPDPAPSHSHRAPRAPSQNTAASAEARLKSGANPRQKLTDDELAAKMEKMKLLAAEKTRKFHMAEQDERQHAEAYARGMEDARRRRADEAERRRRADEDRRKLDDERARNRERKLKAMSAKDGGWDEGKDVVAEQEARRVFRGANGGVRGSRGPGLSGSRFARDSADRPDVDRFLDERHTSRGRGGRGPRGGGGGTRGGPATAGRDKAAAPKPANAVPPLTTDAFPALPAGAASKKEPGEAAAKAPDVLALPSPPPAGGKWDDEMELMDAVGKDT